MTVSEKYLRDLLREVVSLRAGGVCEWPGCNSTICDPHHYFSRDSNAVRWDADSCLWLCSNHHTGTISAHHTPMIFEAMIIYYQIRNIEWLQSVIEKRNMVVKDTPTYRQECKEKLLVELERMAA
ncbi:MAG: hypothetical protein WC248_02930 [Candidatus Methanomethylophilaceae archaeon]